MFTLDMCPSTAGLKSWRAMAFSPQTSAVYIPLNLNCEHAVFGAEAAPKEVGRSAGNAVRRTNLVHPESGGNLGEFRAMDVRTGAAKWQQRLPSPMNTAALATGGGLVFAGDWDRDIYAFDAATGKILWTHAPLHESSRLSDYLCGQRATVRGGSGRSRRCELVDTDRTRLAARHSTSSRSEQCAVRLRVARMNVGRTGTESCQRSQAPTGTTRPAYQEPVMTHEAALVRAAL